MIHEIKIKYEAKTRYKCEILYCYSASRATQNISASRTLTTIVIGSNFG